MQYSQVSNIDDIHYLILLEMDIDTLANYCHTNTSAQKYCNRPSFWREKFNDDQLPMIGEEPTNLQAWINRYKLILQAKNDIRHVMIMREMGTDDIFITGPSVLYNMLGIVYKSDKKDKIKLKIIYDKGHYLVIVNAIKVTTLSEYELVQFLIPIQYMILVNTLNNKKPIYMITDYDKVPYIVNNDMMNYFSKKGGDAYYNNIAMLAVRFAMCNTIIYLEKNPIMLTNKWYDHLQR